MAAGDFHIRRNSADTTAIPSGGTTVDASWDTLVEESGSIVTYSSPNLQLDIGIYLLTYTERFYTADTTGNTRVEIQGEIHVSGTGVVGGYSQGYIRKTSGAQSAVLTSSMILEVTVDNTDVFTRFYRTDSSVSGTINRVPDNGGFTVLELDDAHNYGLYSTVSDTINATESSLALSATSREDTGITRSGSDVTLTNAGRYLVSYTMNFSQAGTGREECIGFLELDTIAVPGTQSACYVRGSESCQDGALHWVGIIDVTAAQVLAVRHSSVPTNGSFALTNGHLNIWQLPGTAETAIMEATTGDWNSSGAFTFDTVPQIDATSFTASALSSNIDVDQRDHVLAFGTCSQLAADSPQRAYPHLRLSVDGTDTNYTGGAYYHRNSGGTGQAAATVSGILTSLSANASIEVNISSLSGVSGTLTNDGAQLSTLSLGSIWGPYTFPPAITDMEDEQIDIGETDNVITGVDFGSTQGVGKVELGSQASYGGTLVEQTIDSWSGTSIQFDSVQGAHLDGTVWIYVTSNAGLVSPGYRVNLGIAPYDDYISNLSPDHYWKFNNSNADDGVQGDRPVGNAGSGTTYTASPIAKNVTHSLLLNNVSDSTEYADSDYTNVGNTHQVRYMGGWVEVNSYQKTPACFYEEGGGVNNFYFVVGFGNILLINAADSSQGFKVQAYSDNPLVPNRPYHVMFKFEGSGWDNEFRLFVDGVLQSKTDGNPVGNPHMSTHSGDCGFGKPDGNLDTGGTDIAYNACVEAKLSHWATFSAIGGGAPLTVTEIREDLFEQGALATVTLSGTEGAMQTALDTYADTVRPNYPCAFEISADADVELTADNITFDELCSITVKVLKGNVTWVLANGSTIDESKVVVVAGSFTVVEAVPVTITVRDAADSSVIQDSPVLILADTGGALPVQAPVTVTRSGTTVTVTHTSHGFISGNRILISGANETGYNGKFLIGTIPDANSYTYEVTGTPTSPGTGTITCTAVIVDDTSDTNGEVTANHRYSTDQPVIGKARRATIGTKYKTGLLSGTIASSGLSADIYLINDE